MIDRAIELIKQGLSVREAAGMLDITDRHLHVIMHRHKVKVSDLRPCAKKGPVVHINGKYQGKYTPGDVRDAIAKGAGYKGASEILKTDHQCLRGWCRKNGISVKEVLGNYGVKRSPDSYKNQYDYPRAVKVVYEQATLKDLAVRRPWFGGVLCV